MKNLQTFEEFINESQIMESYKNTHKIILTFTDSRLLNRFKTTPTFFKMVSPNQMKSLIVGDNHLTVNNVALNGLERMSSMGLYSMNKLNESKKPKGAPDWHDSDAPEAEGRFRDLNPKDLAAWLIKTRKRDLKKITGSLNQQIVFNRNSDPDYAKKMEKTREEVYKQLGREDLLESIKIEYKGKQYWVNNVDLNDHENSKVFAFTDSDLSNVAKVNGKTLMFTIKDIQDILKEAVSYSYSTVNGKRIVSNWAASTDKESEITRGTCKYHC